jgi:hypothetical protein
MVQVKETVQPVIHPYPIEEEVELGDMQDRRERDKQVVQVS